MIFNKKVKKGDGWMEIRKRDRQRSVDFASVIPYNASMVELIPSVSPGPVILE
jgi:hypothetical protein